MEDAMRLQMVTAVAFAASFCTFSFCAWAAPPLDCDTAHAPCAAADDGLETIVVPPRPHCVEGPPTALVDSCKFVHRFHAIVAKDGHAPAHAWAGLYRSPVGFAGTDLVLDRDGWAGLRETSDVGSSPGIEGRYSIQDGMLIVDLASENRPSSVPSRLAYIPVHWGPRLYLMSSDAFKLFAGYYNSRADHAAGSIEMTWPLLRARDAGKTVCGLPKVPSPWSKQLHPQPVGALPAC
jgi:hypothetical protein